MMKHKAFSLMEVLIALALSGFIIAGLLQSYRGIIRYLERSRSLIGVNRRICLLFNQMERDFMTAFIPEKFVQDDDFSEKNQGGKTTQDEKSDKKLKKDEQEKNELFVGLANENELLHKVQGKKMLPFKMVSFVNTNPLQIFGQRRIRYVRILYSLEPNKERSKKSHISYDLIRKESRDIANFNMKINEFDYEKLKQNPISSHVIAQDVKSMYVEYVGVKKEKREESNKKQKDKDILFGGKEVTSFTWGNKKNMQGVVPKRIEVTIELWNEALDRSYLFHSVMPILSFPTVEEDKTTLHQRVSKENPLLSRPSIQANLATAKSPLGLQKPFLPAGK